MPHTDEDSGGGGGEDVVHCNYVVKIQSVDRQQKGKQFEFIQIFTVDVRSALRHTMKLGVSRTITWRNDKQIIRLAFFNRNSRHDVSQVDYRDANSAKSQFGGAQK